MKNTKILKYSILIIILLSPFIWLLYLMFFWGWFWMMSEVPWNKLTQTYLKIWDYTIWKQKWFYNICSTSSWCLDWEIWWFKEVNSNIYIYIEVNYWNWISWDTKFYDYNLFKWKPTLFGSSYMYDTDVTIYDLNDLPKYWYLSNNSLKLYSENDLKRLPQEQQQIFKELEKNPTIIIDWVDYTKK
jgi:hypothetical protein